MQNVVTKDKLACFLDTQPIPDLVYETECTEHPTLSIDAEDAGDVVSLWTNTTDCSKHHNTSRNWTCNTPLNQTLGN